MDFREMKMLENGVSGDISLSQLNPDQSSQPRKRLKVEANCRTSPCPGNMSENLIIDYHLPMETQCHALHDSNEALVIDMNHKQTARVDEKVFSHDADMIDSFNLHKGINLNDRSRSEKGLTLCDKNNVEHATISEPLDSKYNVNRNLSGGGNVHVKRLNEKIPQCGIEIISNHCLLGDDCLEESACSVAHVKRCFHEMDAKHENVIEESCKEKSSGLKRKGIAENLKSLRRSSRRGSLISTENHIPRVSLDENPSSVASEGHLEHSELPLKLQLPPSSKNLNLDGVSVLDVFFIYACLRSFSTLLFLSPFHLGDFVAALKCQYPTSLFDFIHVSLFQILRKQLEFLSREGTQSAIDCLRGLNWCLLDLISWPIFLANYLLIHNNRYKSVFDGDYYKQPASVKVEILRCLCDDVLEVEVIRSEINRRLESSVPDLDLDRNVNTEAFKKKRVGLMRKVYQADELNDWNSDECCLCNMDGNLICCDGCPAAYHSKCVGVVNDLLPDGDWFCPECIIAKNMCTKMQDSLRGAELLGIDHNGRLYFTCCSYLLVSDPSIDESSFYYYQSRDINAVIEVLKSSDIDYRDISSAISKHWNIPEQISIENPNTSLEESIDTFPHLQSAIGYVNLYDFAQSASLVAEELIRKSSDKKNNKDCTWSVEEIISAQLKIIVDKCAKFQFPSLPNVDMVAQKENCGWCFSCKTPSDDESVCCLFKMFKPNLVVEYCESDMGDIQLRRARNGHLFDVLCHIMSVEVGLHGLLLGPWLNPLYTNIWRQAVLSAPDVKSVKHLLLILESNLRPRAIKDEWFKHVDSANVVGSCSHFVKHGMSRRRTKISDSESNSSMNSPTGLVLYWWRGGRLSRWLFAWKLLPRSLAFRAARQAGCRKIPGILYPENSDFARRSKYVAWQASVEISNSVEQLVVQVRDFDLNIKWDDIKNTLLLPLLDKDTKKAMRSFKKVIIRRKSTEKSVAKYLLDFGKRRFIPDVVSRYGCMVENDSKGRKRYWLDESHVPLHHLKSFEEKRVSRNSTSPRETTRLKNPSRRNIFSYLFSKAQCSENYQCGHCNKNVLISEAISCQHCNGFFHKNHVRKTTSECMFTCHKCWDPNHLIIRSKRTKVPSRKYKLISTDSKAAKLRRNKKASRKEAKPKKKKENSDSAALRRSTRKIKFVFRGIRNADGTNTEKKRCGSIKIIHRNPKKNGFSRRKRTQLFHTYWLNGLLLSEKPNDERISEFRRKRVVADQMLCCLCSQGGFNLISCDFCGDWFHGDAFGMNVENKDKLIKFKCHTCRKKNPPVCPHMEACLDEVMEACKSDFDGMDT